MENLAAKELARRPARLGVKRQLRTGIREGRRRRVGTRRDVRMVHGTLLSLYAQLVSRLGILESSRICQCHCARAFSLLFGPDDSLWRETLVGYRGISATITGRSGI